VLHPHLSLRQYSPSPHLPPSTSCSFHPNRSTLSPSDLSRTRSRGRDHQERHGEHTKLSIRISGTAWVLPPNQSLDCQRGEKVLVFLASLSDRPEGRAHPANAKAMYTEFSLPRLNGSIL
jgi:hypothetical protein